LCGASSGRPCCGGWCRRPPGARTGVKGLGGQVAVAPFEGEPQPLSQDHLIPGPFQLDAVDVLVADEPETIDRRQLELALGAAAGHA
jgi:hypothetical protein